MNLFQRKLAVGILGLEGGYAFHPSDRGGETIWGITVGTARANGYHGAMREMTRETALSIYEAEYFKGPGLDRVAPISEKIAEEVFDSGVNCGPGRAVKWLQECLNAFNRRGKDYSDIIVDGDIGPATLNALQAFMARRGAMGEVVLLRALNSIQGFHYLTLSKSDQRQEDFTFGWFANRVVI